jgi:very-short-patch-repair endonuclease
LVNTLWTSICAKLRIAIELDGEIHNEQKHYDRLRDKELEERGIHVLRFSNDEVVRNIDAVLNKLAS